MHILFEPMLLLLLGATGVYFFLGDRLEAFVLLGSIIPIVLMEFFQEKKTDEAINALDKLIVEKCQVFRDGKMVTLLTEDLVPNDVVYVTAGDKIPADGVLIDSPGLMIDEAILTGESSPVVKEKITNHNQAVDSNKLFQGTLVTQGEGYFTVVATGKDTEYGKLGGLLESIERVSTPLQKKINKLVKVVAIVAVAVALSVGVIITMRQGFVLGILGTLTIAMSIIPEEFPIVYSVFLIMGVWRMTKKQALVRQMAMVETLGSVTTICSDKTGTLTEGALTLEKVYFNNSLHTVQNLADENFKSLINDSLLALERVASDPIELEVQRFAKQMGFKTEEFHKNFNLVNDSPFDASTKMVHHIWSKDNKAWQYSAGAPEFIINSCAFSAAARQEVTKAYEDLANDGYRVIGLAKGAVSDGKFVFNGLEFRGLLAMADPPRAGVKEAIDICHKAGLRVIMITGDNQFTAKNIAGRIGLRDGKIVNGSELETMTAEQIREVVKNTNIFVRVKPEQKFFIVDALQQNGEVVSMTGDGVNDAPALKKSNIGIAMGLKGTEVAREAAGIVLLDDNFTTIVRAVEEGRRIYDNLRQAFVFLFTFHIPIIGLALGPILLGQDLLFLPIHVIFLELINDPASVLGFEREPARQNIMADPPRPPNEPLINFRLWRKAFIQGLSIFAVSFGVYYFYDVMRSNAELARTAAFTTLIYSQILVIFAAREWVQIKKNILLLIIPALGVVALSVILYVPVMRQLFHFVHLTSKQNLLAVGLSLVCAVVVRVARRK